jgi:hypothetical protein
MFTQYNSERLRSQLTRVFFLGAEMQKITLLEHQIEILKELRKHKTLTRFYPFTERTNKNMANKMQVTYRVLGYKVLAVATKRIEGT